MMQLDLFQTENELIKDRLLKDVDQLMTQLIFVDKFGSSIEDKFINHNLRQEIIATLEKLHI